MFIKLLFGKGQGGGGVYVNRMLGLHIIVYVLRIIMGGGGDEPINHIKYL